MFSLFKKYPLIIPFQEKTFYFYLLCENDNINI